MPHSASALPLARAGALGQPPGPASYLVRSFVGRPGTPGIARTHACRRAASRPTRTAHGAASMSRDILSGLPDATRGEIISFMTFFKGERARTLEALDGDFEDCLEDRIRGVDPPFSLEDVTSAVDHLQVSWSV